MGFFEWIKSVIENIKERIKNPFTERNSTPFAGAFFIALIIYNWKLIFTLFNFDSSATRTDKIAVISEFLQKENWISRIGYPTLIAFGTILFYYIFNNISLGITTFFNRWFRAAILNMTDKGKLITREDYESRTIKFNRLNKRFEEVNGAYIESQAQEEQLKSKIAENEVRIRELVTTNEKIFSERESIQKELAQKEIQIEKIEAADKTVQIVYARYGKYDKYKEVTNEVRTIFSSTNKLIVRNEFLGGDPLSGIHKELLILFIFQNKISSITLNEYYELEIDMQKGTYEIKETTESQIAYADSENAKKFLELLFPGEWQLDFKGRLNGIEDVKIVNGNQYYARPQNASMFSHYYNIEDTIINVEAGKIIFKKVGIQNNNRIIDSVLNIIEIGKQYSGTEENGAVNVTYLRIK